MTDQIARLRLELQQLDAQHAAGILSADQHASARAAIERQLLDHVLKQPAAAGAAAPPAAAAARPKASGPFVGLLGVAIVAIAVAGYAWTGSPGLISGLPHIPAGAGGGSPHDTINPEEFAQAVERLAEKLKEKPDSFEGWAMLARSYVQMGRFADAVPAFERANALNASDARLLADYADALAVNNGRSLDGEPTRLIERALKIDPSHLKSLALAGTAAFNRKDYAGAVRHWEKMAQVAPPDSPFLGQVRDGIAEARQLGGLPPAAGAAATTPPQATPAAAASPKPAPPPPSPTATAAGGVSGSVRLAPALAAQASPNDTVFVFARPAEGSRMPLAILRRQVKDLPLEFKLDDSQAMSEGAKLSLFPKVVVDARISKSGQAQPAPGDLVGRSPPVANNASGVMIEIGEAIKP